MREGGDLDDRREQEQEARGRILRALEVIAFDQGLEAKISERMKAMELIGRLTGLWDPAPEDRLAGEISKLSELLEQRRERRGGL